MDKTPEWATHYIEMIDGGEFFVEMEDGVITQFEGVRGSDGLIPHSEYKSSIYEISEYKSQLNHKYPKLGEL